VRHRRTIQLVLRVLDVVVHAVNQIVGLARVVTIASKGGILLQIELGLARLRMDHNALLARTLGLLLLPCQLLLLPDGLPIQHVRLLHLMHSKK
jgi:hypothetical protein